MPTAKPQPADALPSLPPATSAPLPPPPCNLLPSSCQCKDNFAGPGCKAATNLFFQSFGSTIPTAVTVTGFNFDASNPVALADAATERARVPPAYTFKALDLFPIELKRLGAAAHPRFLVVMHAACTIETTFSIAAYSHIDVSIKLVASLYTAGGDPGTVKVSEEPSLECRWWWRWLTLPLFRGGARHFRSFSIATVAASGAPLHLPAPLPSLPACKNLS